MMKTAWCLLTVLALNVPAGAADRVGSYVAMGSSYAAGVGLGPVLKASPAVCGRTSQGYPQRVARDLGLKLVDASCGGATVEQILTGGQGVLPPQIEAVSGDATLVTITVGGNDVGYVGGMMRAALAHGAGNEPSPAVEERAFAALHANLQAMFGQIRRRAPHARIVVATYPTVLPRQDSCAALRLSVSQVALFRDIADRLAAVTRDTAREAGADIVDMASIYGHDVCSADPWTNGAAPRSGAPFHPNAAGAAATASTVEALLRRSPA